MSTVHPITSDIASVVQEQNPLLPLLEKQSEAFIRRGVSSYKQRIELLNTLGHATGVYKDRLIEAVDADFGHRSEVETLMAELLGSVGEIRMTKMKLKGWMKPKKPGISLATLPASGRVLYQPKGVVGIMGAWNYPVFLILSPLVGVLAAGNHAMIKPPDMTPNTGEVIKDMIAEFFDEEIITVVTGGIEEATQFSKLPFDHLVYTGGTEIGRKIMVEAARNLTPVTLEMGGKSPVLISEDFPINKAIERILMGKCMNSGQTCIAPDYVLVPKTKEKEFVDQCSDALKHRYPTLVGNDDVTWIINERHYQRINGLIEDAKAKGANAIEINPNGDQIPEGQRIIPPTLLTDVNEDMAVMNQEIFGPVLPILTYETLDEALMFIKKRPRPLAFYYFDKNRRRANTVMEQSIAGGSCVNETMLHIAHENMPFGGIGPSGLGAYHGFYGFSEFSHQKAVLYQRSWFSPAGFMKQPYKGYMRKAMNFLVKVMT